MAALENFEIVKCGPYKFVGKSVYIGNKRGSECMFDFMWKQSDWVFEELDGMSEYASDIPHNAALRTWEKYDDKNELFGYYVGRFMKADAPNTKDRDMDYFEIPEGYMAKAWARGRRDDFIAKTGLPDNEELVLEEISRAGYRETAWKFIAGIFPGPDENGESFVGVYCPCVPLNKKEKAKWEAERQAAQASENARDALIKALKATSPRGNPVDIDLAAMAKRGDFTLSYADGRMELSSHDSRNGMATPQKFSAPLRIELRAKADGPNIQVQYGKGTCSFDFLHKKLTLCDIENGRQYDYRGYEELPSGEFTDIEWIIGRDFMAVKVNGELRHIGNNYEYIRAFKSKRKYSLSSPITIAAWGGSAVTVERLRVTEI